ncbi:MAG: M14 family zinc carboxypeptidase, partial [candidate division WOR-3 bacterium]
MNRLIAVMLVFLAAGLLWGKSLNPEHEMLVRVQASRADIPELKSLGLYIYQVGPDYVQGAILPDAAQALAGHGFKYEVLISDMVAYAEEMMIPSGGFGVYHTYQQIMDSFHLVASANPNLCQLETIAQSATGRYVIALKITENPRQGNHRPRLVWDGTTHGNENIGTEVCWYFMQLLVGQYGIDPLITQLVNTREIWLIPVVNPDGLVNRTRGNSSVSDPNRDYGYAWNAESGANVPWYSPEIRGFRNFMQNRPFVVSMTYHSGTTSVMWPWSYSTVATHDSIA